MSGWLQRLQRRMGLCAAKQDAPVEGFSDVSGANKGGVAASGGAAGGCYAASSDDTSSVDTGRASGALPISTGHADAICRVIGSSKSEFVTGGEDRALVLHCCGEAAPVHTWRGHTRSISSLARAHHSAIFFSGSRDLSIRTWTTAVEAPTRTFPDAHELTVTGLAVSSSDAKLLSGSRDAAIRLWDVEAGSAVSTMKVSRNIVTCIGFLPGSETLFAQGSEDLTLRIWDTRNSVLKPVQKLQGYVYFPLCLDTSADGHYVLTGSKGFDGVGCEAKLWDLRTSAMVREFTGHNQDVVGCAITKADGGVRHFATASKDSSLRLWDAESGACLAEHIEDARNSFTDMALVDDGDHSTLAVAAFSGALFTYALGSGGTLVPAQSSLAE